MECHHLSFSYCRRPCRRPSCSLWHRPFSLCLCFDFYHRAYCDRAWESCLSADRSPAASCQAEGRSQAGGSQDIPVAAHSRAAVRSQAGARNRAVARRSHSARRNEDPSAEEPHQRHGYPLQAEDSHERNPAVDIRSAAGTLRWVADTTNQAVDKRTAEGSLRCWVVAHTGREQLLVAGTLAAGSRRRSVTRTDHGRWAVAEAPELVVLRGSLVAPVRDVHAQRKDPRRAAAGHTGSCQQAAVDTLDGRRLVEGTYARAPEPHQAAQARRRWHSLSPSQP